MPITHHSPFLYPLARFINIGREGGGGVGRTTAFALVFLMFPSIIIFSNVFLLSDTLMA